MPENHVRKRGYAKAWKHIPNFNRYRKYRVALTPEQCVEYDLARNAAKSKDPSLDTFLVNFGHTLTADDIDDGCGVQVEVDRSTRQFCADRSPTPSETIGTPTLTGLFWHRRSDIAELDGIVDELP